MLAALVPAPPRPWRALLLPSSFWRQGSRAWLLYAFVRDAVAECRCAAEPCSAVRRNESGFQTNRFSMFGWAVCPTSHTVSSIVAHSPLPARPHTLVDTCSAVFLAASYAFLPRFMASADNQTTKDESKTEQQQGVLITACSSSSERAAGSELVPLKSHQAC